MVGLITNPSERTLKERERLARQMDNFTTFTWDNLDMFKNFGAFIINESKGGLKFYNGASYKNTYTKQQYEDGYTNLVGVTFDSQKISFTIGVYWISIEDYRVLMNTLHPYKVAMLQFGFEKTYGYECKLAGVKDSARYILGREESLKAPSSESKLNVSSVLDGDVGKTSTYRYYTELQLSFEIVGKQCAKEIEPYEVHRTTLEGQTESDHYLYITSPYADPPEKWPSDLEFPFTLNLNDWYIYEQEGTLPAMHLRAYACIADKNDPLNPFIKTKLFEVNIINLKLAPHVAYTGSTFETVSKINLRYDSEQGLLYWQNGDKVQLLSLLSVNASGQRFVNYLESHRFYWPGRLDYPEVDTENYCFYLYISDLNKNTYFLDDTNNVLYSARRRTNVI